MGGRKLSWLERGSSNRDALAIGVVFVVVPVVLGALNAADVLATLPLAVWVGVAVVALSMVVAYRRGRASAEESVPPDVSRYVEHTTDAIDTLQLVLVGEIKAIAAGEFVQEGIFEPAHTILSQGDRGDVRLSILEPDGDDFVMAMALGHSIESRRRFRLPIAGSFAGMTFGDGMPRMSNDTADDDRFVPHPEARPGREYRSIVAVPIRSGHRVKGVFVVVAQAPDAFSAADVAYVRELAAIISLVRATPVRHEPGRR